MYKNEIRRRNGQFARFFHYATRLGMEARAVANVVDINDGKPVISGEKSQKKSKNCEQWHRRAALALAAQLPEGTADALIVVELLNELVRGFMSGHGGGV